MMEVVVTIGAISRAKLQSNHDHRQTNTQFFLQAGCPSCRPTNSVKALKVNRKVSVQPLVRVLPTGLKGSHALQSYKQQLTGVK